MKAFSRRGKTSLKWEEALPKEVSCVSNLPLIEKSLLKARFLFKLFFLSPSSFRLRPQIPQNLTLLPHLSLSLSSPLTAFQLFHQRYLPHQKYRLSGWSWNLVQTISVESLFIQWLFGLGNRFSQLRSTQESRLSFLAFCIYINLPPNSINWISLIEALSRSHTTSFCHSFRNETNVSSSLGGRWIY